MRANAAASREWDREGSSEGVHLIEHLLSTKPVLGTVGVSASQQPGAAGVTVPCVRLTPKKIKGLARGHPASEGPQLALQNPLHAALGPPPV